jgi:membrane protease YdiL (CAAX protease family)
MTRRTAIIALLLLVPAPSLGTATAMILAPGPGGHAVFIALKVWILVLPMLWYLLIEKGRLSWSPPRRGGLGVGALTGVAIAAVIGAAYLAFASRFIDLTALKDAVTSMGLAHPLAYLGAAAYWIAVNSLLEEYVYRWFVYHQCEQLMMPALAVPVAALVFTAHHVIALSVYLEPGLNLLASTGIFAGSCVWSWCYHRYRSIWPGWLSHAGADIAVFAIGWHLVFS